MSKAGTEAGPTKVKNAKGGLSRASWKVRVAVVTMVLVSAALAGAGATLLWAPPRVTTVEKLPPVSAYEGAEATTGAEVVMPDVVGLSQEVAQRALVTSGVDLIPEVTRAPAAGPSGRVLSQTPEPGVVVGGAVDLQVTEATPIPEVIGQPVDAVRTTLGNLGIEVLASREVKPDTPSGQVLSISPGVGEAAPLVVEVVVADEGDVWPLTELSSSEETASCYTDADYIYGRATFTDVLVCEPNEEASFVEYSLEQRADAFTAVLGVDDAPKGTTMVVVVTGDGKELGTFTATAGEVENVRIEVPDITLLRFALAATDIEEPPALVIGEPGLRGDPDLLSELR